MSDISLETVTGKLNRVGYESFLQALRRAKTSGNRNMELAHWLVPLLQSDRNDVAITLDHFKVNRAMAASDVDRAVESLKRNETEMPAFRMRSSICWIAVGTTRRCSSGKRRSARDTFCSLR